MSNSNVFCFNCRFQVASICDIVLNHTANDSEWLMEHPDATYSCFTMPHLRPAFLLDVVFGWVTRDVIAGKLEHVGVPTLVENEDHIQALRHHIHTTYLSKANLSQFYQCDVTKYVLQFSEKVKLTKNHEFFSVSIFKKYSFVNCRSHCYCFVDSHWKTTNCLISCST